MTQISTILERKGTEVATIHPDASLSEAVQVLAERNIGALVVSHDGHHLDGIISERDIMRQLAAGGEDCLAMQVAAAMSTQVITCGREASVDQLMSNMTARRVRHIPVLESDELVGLVSIGDVVKSRIDELEVQTEALESYVSGSSY